jgi:phosphoribosylformimino-5-aminoimidazole carboxamide ribotide isomerase
MRVIGVVDLLAGRAVHAKAGTREHYRPVSAVAGAPIEPGDARALAEAYVGDLGITEMYVADLDAILGGPLQSASIAAVARSFSRPRGRPEPARPAAPLWLDAGVASPERAQQIVGLGVDHVVVGLETLPSYDTLAEICAAVGGNGVAFSLDLRAGEPVVAKGGIARGEQAHVVAARAVRAGVGAIIVIDLARVGTSGGLDRELIARVRDAAPEVALLAGGGVRGSEDLLRLADLGCEGALVATALLEGRIGAAEVAAARRLGHRRSEVP